MPFGRISLKAYSRLRHSLGLPGGYPDGAAVGVRKAMERHGITKGVDGLIDADDLHARWEAERGTRPPTAPAATTGELAGEPQGEPAAMQARRADAGAGEPRGSESSRRKATATPQVKRTGESLADARARKESALANIREKEDLEKERALVDRQAAYSAFFIAARKVRDRGLAEVGPLADRLVEAAGVALTENPHAELRPVVVPLVEAAFRAVFDDLASRLPDLVAGDAEAAA